MPRAVAAALFTCLALHAGDVNSAIRNGDATALTSALEHGGDPNERDALGATALHDAVWAERADLVVQLLDHKADINARHADGGSTPLAYAALRGSRELVSLLLRRGAAVNLANSRGDAPLHLAVANNALESTAVLLSSTDVNQTNANGETPLHLAAAKGLTALVNVLLNAGADPTRPNREGSTALDAAFRAGESAALTRLLHAEKQPQPAATRLIEASVRRGKADLLGALIAAGADPNLKLERGQSLLHVAALAGNVELIDVLLRAGTQVNAKDTDGATPLHYAATTGSVGAISALLAAGADINARETQSGNTPLYEAAAMKRTEAAALLVSRGADPQIPNNAGRFPEK